MREQRWKQFFVRKREGIGPGLRKKLILFNLAGIVLLALITWSCAGFPLPTAKMEFRRLERANQLPPSEIVWIVDGASKDLLNLSKDDRSCFAVDRTAHEGVLGCGCSREPCGSGPPAGRAVHPKCSAGGRSCPSALLEKGRISGTDRLLDRRGAGKDAGRLPCLCLQLPQFYPLSPVPCPRGDG